MVGVNVLSYTEEDEAEWREFLRWLDAYLSRSEIWDLDGLWTPEENWEPNESGFSPSTGDEDREPGSLLWNYNGQGR